MNTEAPPYLAQRSRMRCALAASLDSLSTFIADLDPIGSGVTIEHGYDPALMIHELQLAVTHPDHEPYACVRVACLHPVECGCDALTNELVLHG